jgi:hypothetical protein
LLNVAADDTPASPITIVLNWAAAWTNSARVTLPVPPHPRRIEAVLVADQPQILDLRLRDQHAIERIAAGDRQLSGWLGVLQRNEKAGGLRACRAVLWSRFPTPRPR